MTATDWAYVVIWGLIFAVIGITYIVNRRGS